VSNAMYTWFVYHISGSNQVLSSAVIFVVHNFRLLRGSVIALRIFLATATRTRVVGLRSLRILTI